MSTVVELWEFLRARRKIWLTMVVLVILAFGGLVVVTQGSAIAPFIYAIF